MAVVGEKQGSVILEFLLAASVIALLVSSLIMVLPTGYHDLFYSTFQFLWPMLGILLLLRIYRLNEDRDVRFFAGFFAVGLVPWTLSILFWEVLLPLFYNDSLAYYLTGFGFLLCYVVLIVGLRRIKHPRMRYLSPSTNSYVNIIGVFMVVSLLAFIAVNIRWDNPHLPDVFILVLYLVSDIFILLICSKLINTDLKVELKYLVFVVTEFVLINWVGDALYMMRWLLPLRSINGIPITDLIDPIYNVSLIFMVAALAIYSSGLRDRALAEMRKKLDDTRLFFDDIVAHAPDAMFICDAKGNVVQANDQMLRLFVIRDSGDLKKVNIFEHSISMGWAGDADVADARAGRPIIIPRISYRWPAGDQERFLSLKLFPVYGTGKEIQNYFGIVEDITGRLQAEEELMDSRRQIEMYMDLMGHDINNMNQIGIGFLEIARDRLASEGTLSRDSMTLIDRPLEAFGNSSKLIRNIRKIQKARGKETRNEALDAGKLIEDAIGEHRSIPDRQIVIEYRPVQGLVVEANGVLKDVFSNLIGNAIKHSPPEKPLYITIQARTEAGGDHNYVLVSVEDNGPGIPDALKGIIFDRFTPGSIMTRARGLGLYLVRTLVESYGGSVWVEDRVAGDYRLGSRFVVRLPASSPGGSPIAPGQITKAKCE